MVLTSDASSEQTTSPTTRAVLVMQLKCNMSVVAPKAPRKKRAAVFERKQQLDVYKKSKWSGFEICGVCGHRCTSDRFLYAHFVSKHVRPADSKIPSSLTTVRHVDEKIAAEEAKPAPKAELLNVLRAWRVQLFEFESHQTLLPKHRLNKITTEFREFTRALQAKRLAERKEVTFEY